MPSLVWLRGGRSRAVGFAMGGHWPMPMYAPVSNPARRSKSDAATTSSVSHRPVRGMKDLFDREQRVQNWLVRTAREVCDSYDYRQVRKASRVTFPGSRQSQGRRPLAGERGRRRWKGDGTVFHGPSASHGHSYSFFLFPFGFW
jgi:hypothetical protein